MTTAPVGGHAAVAGTIETRRSWLVAWCALGVLSISFGAPLITVVALKPIAAEFGNIRSVPALSYALAWLGSAAGGIVMGLVAEQVGVRWTVIFGVLMIAAGLLLSSHPGGKAPAPSAVGTASLKKSGHDRNGIEVLDDPLTDSGASSRGRSNWRKIRRDIQPRRRQSSGSFSTLPGS